MFYSHFSQVCYVWVRRVTIDCQEWGHSTKGSPPYSKKGSKFQMTDSGRKEEEEKEEEEEEKEEEGSSVGKGSWQKKRRRKRLFFTGVFFPGRPCYLWEAVNPAH